jgi:hypothetical protein
MTAVVESIRSHLHDIVCVVRCSSVAIVVESSQRADPLLRERFNPIEVSRGGKEIPVEYCLMPKSANEPELEIADFIVSTSGSMARQRHSGRDGFPPDFTDVFMRIASKYAFFRNRPNKRQ